MNIFDKLKRPFPVNRIHWRVGATTRDKSNCIPLAYVDARDVMQRLDDVCGPTGWQCRYPLSDSGLLICEIGIHCEVFGDESDEWIWKSNGAGDTQVEAEKGKASDAFKRAAVLWGIARYLYALPNVWVAYDGKNFTPPSLPHWATPEGYDEIMKKRSDS